LNLSGAMRREEERTARTRPGVRAGRSTPWSGKSSAPKPTGTSPRIESAPKILPLGDLILKDKERTQPDADPETKHCYQEVVSWVRYYGCP